MTTISQAVRNSGNAAASRKQTAVRMKREQTKKNQNIAKSRFSDRCVVVWYVSPARGKDAPATTREKATIIAIIDKMVPLKCAVFLSATLHLLLIIIMSRESNSAVVTAFVTVAPNCPSSSHPSTIDRLGLTHRTCRSRRSSSYRGIGISTRSGYFLMNAINGNNLDYNTVELDLNNAETSLPRVTISSPLLVRRISRRSVVISILGLASITSRPQAAHASSTNSDLFKPNPLTNPLLEQIRIWNQDEADNIRYGGELASGLDGPPSALDQYVTLLQPILGVEYDLSRINLLLQGRDSSGKDADTNKKATQKTTTKKEQYISIFTQINSVLSSSSSLLSDKLKFKKAFNAFADNIYYSDPDRANLYLGGGAIPKTSQSVAYLLRNDILTTVEDMRAEVLYLLKELSSEKNSADDVLGESDVYEMCKLANEGIKKYLDLVPPKELEVARAKFWSVSQ